MSPPRVGFQKSIFSKNAFLKNWMYIAILLLSISTMYLYYLFHRRGGGAAATTIITAPSTTILQQPSLNAPFAPPLKTVDIRGDISTATGFGYGVPINIRTNSANTAYQQVGILTRAGDDTDKAPTILPLMGRNLLNGRDKWQYYTMENSGANINNRLPVKVNGKSGTAEYGCDSINDGDHIYVDGYNDTFKATLYENAQLNYIPI